MNDSEFFSNTGFAFTDTFTDVRMIYSSDKGWTDVYTARKALKRFVLKALKPDLREDPFYVGLLRKEFEVGFRLEHPNIVHTYSFEKIEGLGLCIVLEWVEGETLAWHLSNGTLDEKTWLKIAEELCDALEYLKTRQIVHRDVKPSNAILTFDGNQTKLIDFGFADSPEYGLLKHSGGTRGYASPEQISNSNIKSTSDIYALGKILEILPIRKNKKIRGLIRRMCSEHPSERPQSAAEIKEELRKASVQRPWSIFLLLLVTLVIGFASVFFIFQRKDIIKDAVSSENTEEFKVQSVDSIQPGTSITNTMRRVEENQKFKNESYLPTKIEKLDSEGNDSSEVKATKRVVHWIVVLTAQQTRGRARKLREEGDTLWAEHTRMEIGKWVDSQTENVPELRRDCYEEMNKNIEKIRKEGCLLAPILSSS